MSAPSKSTASAALPATFSAWRRTGVRTGVDTGLTLEKDIAMPKPSVGQVLVRIHAVSLNFRDVATLKDEYPGQATPKGIPISDGAGEVVAIGDGVTECAVGTRVSLTCTMHQGGTNRWLEHQNSIGFTRDGALTQYMLVDQNRVVDIGSTLSYEEAAALPCAGVTAWDALYGNHPLKPGRVVLVQGTGGVSILAAQFALAAGARVIATSSSDDKLVRMQKLGVAKADCINYKTTPEWGARAKELTGGRGVDYVVEVGGAATIAQSLAAIRNGGEIALIGFLGGVKGTGVNPVEVLMAGGMLRSVLIGSREEFREMLEAINHHHIRPVIDKVFPFEQAVEAHKYLESGAHFGKVVIKVA